MAEAEALRSEELESWGLTLADQCSIWIHNRIRTENLTIDEVGTAFLGVNVARKVFQDFIYAKNHPLHDTLLEVNIEEWITKGRNYLHLGAYYGLKNTVEACIWIGMCTRSKGNSIFNKKDDFGFTPLDYAESQGYSEIVKLLSCIE